MAISQRYLNIANGHMILTGNTLLISQPGAPGTALSGPFISVNNALQVPGYPTGTTLNWQENSAMAVLTIPAGAKVLYAELTWTSLLIAGQFDYSAFRDDPVTFITPAAATTVAPQFTDNTINIYTRSADVTALVQAGGSGQYTLGRVAGVNGLQSINITGNGAGWYLTVIVENPAEPSRLFQVNVGNVFVPIGGNINFPISGFSTPSTGPVTGKLFAGIQRGDPVVDIIPIFVGPDVANLNFQLSRPPMPDNNMIAGFISNTETGAVIDTSGTFGNNNNTPGNPPIAQPISRWHLDIASFDISPSLTNNQTTLVTQAQSQGPVAAFDFNVFNVQIDAQSADVTATKAADKAFAAVGDTITYTIVATNNGTIQADNVVITDAIPAGTTFVPGSLTGATGTPPTLTVTNPIPAGGSATITFQVTVDQIPVPNPLVNNATVDYTFVPLPGEPPLSGTTTTNDAITQVNDAIIGTVKTVDKSFAKPGDTLTYTLVLTNSGNTAANNVVITDSIPAGTTFVPGSVAGATGTPPTLNVASIPAGGSATVTFQVLVGNAIPDPNPVPNSATVAFAYTLDPANPNGATGSSTSNAVETQVNLAAITTTKTADKAFAATGEIITYTLVLTNSGNVPANNVVLTDAIPAGTTFVPGSVTGATGTPPTLTLLAPIAAGGSATVTFQVQVGDIIPVPNPVLNSASAAFTYTVDPQNPNGASGTSASTVASTQVNSAIINTVKAVDNAYAEPGDVLTYTLTLTNSGNAPANNVVITDAVPAGTSFVAGSVTGATGTLPTLTLPNPIPAGGAATVTFQVQVDNVIPVGNPIPNSASVAFTFTVDPANPNGATGTSDSNTVTTQINAAIVTAEKTAAPAYADVNGLITYTVTLTNTGNVAANNVVLTDAVPAGTTFVPGSLTGATGTPPTLTLNAPLAAGGTAVVTYQVKVGNSVPNPNPVSNSVSAAFAYTVDPTKPNAASGTAQGGPADTQVNTAKLVISKTANKPISYIGDTITYQIAVQNTGNVSADNVVLTDLLPTGVSYVAGSLVVSVPYSGTLASGLALSGPIAAGQTVTLSFQAKVDAIPNPNPILNKVTATYAYTVDPAAPNAVSATASSPAVRTVVFRFNFSQQISDLIESVALEQAALAAIANAEGAKIQAAAAMGDITQQELLCINKSVSDMMESLSMLEAVLKQKLSVVDCQISGANASCM